ncbi:MAG: hypothetical protein N2317_08825, partial [Syntrophales bacterium]|nr:hypothetical protein [Syntrophales bacterium]
QGCALPTELRGLNTSSDYSSLATIQEVGSLLTPKILPRTEFSFFQVSLSFHGYPVWSISPERDTLSEQSALRKTHGILCVYAANITGRH